MDEMLTVKTKKQSERDKERREVNYKNKRG